MKSNANVLSVRVSPLCKFYVRKMSEFTGNPIGFVLAEAIHSYIINYPVSRTRLAKWLREYRATEEQKIEPK